MGTSSGSGARKALECQDKQEAAIEPWDPHWAREPDLSTLTPNFWEDPEPDLSAVLTGDRIRSYHYSVGRMIRPFQEKLLNPASYDLTLGPRCWIEGREKQLSRRDSRLCIPPNSIVFVTTREMLLMPHWLVARFNLKSRLLFKGLLMGAGPQVDPGFMGIISCPLHNISSRSVELDFCEPFAKIDFVKTTWNGCVDLDDVSDEDDLYARANRGELTARGEKALLWPRTANFREPIYFIGDARHVRSSVREIDEKVDKWTGRLDRFSLAGVALVVTLIATMASLFAYTLYHADGRVNDLREQMREAQGSQVGFEPTADGPSSPATPRE